jgi:uncharacterized membrane protein YgcG
MFAAHSAGDQRKERIVQDARGRFEALYTKLRQQEFASALEERLLELANYMLQGNRVEAMNIYKEFTTTSWEQLSSAVMLGLKRLVEFQ